MVWKHLRLLSVGGTRLVLPNHAGVVAEFDKPGFVQNAASIRFSALASILFDNLNLVNLDAQIAPSSASERNLLYKHLEKVKPGDIPLLDLAYPYFAILFILMAKEIEFCIRMKKD